MVMGLVALGLLASCIGGCAASAPPPEPTRSTKGEMNLSDDMPASSNIEDRRGETGFDADERQRAPEEPIPPLDPVDTSPGSLADQAGINHIGGTAGQSEPGGIEPGPDPGGPDPGPGGGFEPGGGGDLGGGDFGGGDFGGGGFGDFGGGFGGGGFGFGGPSTSRVCVAGATSCVLATAVAVGTQCGCVVGGGVVPGVVQ